MNKAELIPVGKIIGLHGLRGEVKVLFYGGDVDFPWKTVHAKSREGETVVLNVKRARRHKGTVLVEFEGFSTRNGSKELIGCELSINKNQLPETSEGEYYYFELIGMDVIEEGGRPLGKITGVIPTGSNDVLEVKGPQGEVLIPAIEGVVKTVSVEKKRIVVILPEGLIGGQ